MKEIVLVLIVLQIFGCSSGRRTVTLNSVRPADISLSSDINTLVILNRTRYNKNAINIVEGVLTGELPEEDKAGVQSYINSCRNQLNRSERFTTKVATETWKGNSLTQAFPEPISWRKIEPLCRRYGAQAVVAVEMFDTDFIVTEGKRKVKKKVEGSAEEIEVIEFYAEGVCNITAGIRVYDLPSRSIADQDLYRKTDTWEAAAVSKKEALASLITKTDATRRLSSNLGVDYAYKIAPMPVQITRSFVGKSKKAPALEQGSRYADVADWEEAIKVWEKGLYSAPTKEAGYMAYNIGIAYEVLGDLDKAIEWAQRSYTQYGNKNGRGYVSTINNRIRNEELARQQLGN